MWETRWLRRIGPTVVALVAVGAIASATARAGPQAWVQRGCPGAASALSTGVRAPAPARGGVRGAPWYRLDPELDRDGALVGQRLSIGTVGGSAVQTLALPAESFAAGPFGRLVLVGSDDGQRSRLQAIDVASSCSWSIGESADVIRRATVDLAGNGILEMRVARAGRADLGVWRRDPGATGDARRVLAPPPPDDRFGATFATELARDVAGNRIAVESCGENACRTRLLDGADRTVGSVVDPGLGGLIGFDGDRVVTYASCRGLPCPIVATDVRSGLQRLVLADGGPAVIADTPDGRRLVDEVASGTEVRLRSTSLAGGASSDLGPLPVDQRLLVTADRAGSGIDIPPGWAVLAPDGRLPADPSSPRALLRHLPDGLTVPIDEAIP
jgi:hypothetical protein